jgi:hypothetical protein
MIDRYLRRGETTTWQVTFYGVDFTIGTRYAILRLRKRGTETPQITRDTQDSGEFTWTTQSSGIGKVKFTAAELLALASGDYIADWWVYDSSDSTAYFYGSARYALANSPVGDPA